MSVPTQDGYSAKTAVELIVDGQFVGVAQVGPDRITLRESRDDLLNRTAVLRITVGSSWKAQDIFLASRSDSDPKEYRYY